MRHSRRHIVHPLAPYVPEGSRILVLGSLPSVRSREIGWYYGHPQNRFWPLIGRLAAEPGLTARDPEACRRALRQLGIAVYDVIAACSIVGSSDASIRDVVPSALDPILDAAPIARIVLNGGLAARLFRRYQAPRPGIELLHCPSTSPANARWSLEALLDCWGPALDGDTVR